MGTKIYIAMDKTRPAELIFQFHIPKLESKSSQNFR